MPLTVQVVTPEREIVVADDVTFVLAHGIEGDVGILPGHAPLLIALGVGPLRIDRAGHTEHMAVDGGFLQVINDRVIVLAEYAVLPSEVDVPGVEREIEELRRRISAEAEAEEARAQLARLEAAHAIAKM